MDLQQRKLGNLPADLAQKFLSLPRTPDFVLE
jgi:hypothetical protein